MQTRLFSLIESLTNVGIGYFTALATQMAVFPLFGIHLPMADNILIGLIFTAVSIVRSYAVRRVFNMVKWGHG